MTVGGREVVVEGGGAAVLLSLDIYGGNRFRNLKKMAGTHFLIGIGNQNGKIGSKKGPESGIPRNSGGIPADFPT